MTTAGPALADPSGPPDTRPPNKPGTPPPPKDEFFDAVDEILAGLQTSRLVPGDGPTSGPAAVAPVAAGSSAGSVDPSAGVVRAGGPPAPGADVQHGASFSTPERLGPPRFEIGTGRVYDALLRGAR